MVVPRPGVVETGPVAFPARVLQRVRAGRAPRGRCSEGLVRVASAQRTCAVREANGGAKRVGQEERRAGRICSADVLVHAKARQEICDRRARLLLHGVQTVVEEIRGRAVDRLPAPPAGAVVDKARRDGAGDRRESIARIPRVGVGAVARQVAVEVVRQGLRAERELLVVRVVGRRDGLRQGRLCLT